MYLKQIVKIKWDVLAVQTNRKECPLFEFLAGLDDSFGGHVSSMLALLNEVAKRNENPQQWLPSGKCHTITNDNKIWQFTAGRLRVAWFFDEGRVIVCTHGFLKTTNNTKKSDQKTAIKCRDDYFVAKNANNITIERETEEE